MIIELFIALLLGILTGIICGLVPGLHVNLLIAFLLLNLDKIPFSPFALSLSIVSLSITYIFVAFIPSIFLSVPDEDSFLAILPGHKLVLEGRGYEAIVTTAFGCLAGTLVSLMLAPVFILFLPYLYSIIKMIIPFILIFISFYIIFRDNHPLKSFIIFILAGLIGLFAFNLPVKEPLTPLLTGLFGLSSIIFSLRKKKLLTEQKIRPIRDIFPPYRSLFKSFSTSFFASPIGSFLPGIGSGHAATIGGELVEHNEKEFLFLTSAISLCVMSLSFVTAYSINKTRTGSAAAVKEILYNISFSDLTCILFVILLTSLIAFMLTIFLAKISSRLINKINYTFLNILVIFIVILINLLITNYLGIIILILSTLIGLYTIKSEIRRINLMSSLLLSSIIYYLIH